MRKNVFLSGVVVVLAGVAASAAAPTPSDLQKGSPAVKSISALAFGPNGVLFIGDPTAAAIFAVETADTKPAGTAEVNVDKIDDKIGGMLGVPGKDVMIADMKVNPASGNVYLAASRAKGSTPVVVRLDRDGKLEALGLKDVSFSSVKLPNATGEAITSMAFVNNNLIVAGVSTEEFASTLRVIPFPFTSADKGTGIEIYHGAHNKVETKSPIRTFVPYNVSGVDYLLASYTCTPLVRLPVADLKPGTKVKGATIAELGNRNKPLDMVIYTKGGKDYILMANSARGVMKIPAEGVGTAESYAARPVGGATTFGIKYETIGELKDVTQLDKLDAGRALLLVQPKGGNASLQTIPLP